MTRMRQREKNEGDRRRGEVKTTTALIEEA